MLVAGSPGPSTCGSPSSRPTWSPRASLVAPHPRCAAPAWLPARWSPRCSGGSPTVSGGARCSSPVTLPLRAHRTDVCHGRAGIALGAARRRHGGGTVRRRRSCSAHLWERFPVEVRATGIAVTYGLATAIVRGTAPLVGSLLAAGWLVGRDPACTWQPSALRGSWPPCSLEPPCPRSMRRSRRARAADTSPYPRAPQATPSDSRRALQGRRRTPQRWRAQFPGGPRSATAVWPPRRATPRRAADASNLMTTPKTIRLSSI